MHFNAAISTVAVALLAGSANAVNMTYYRPAAGVSPLFCPFLYKFYTQAESTSNASVTAFEGYFSDTAKIVLGGQTLWTGKSGAGIFKVAIAGGNQFDHYPRTPSLVSTTSNTQTLAIAGSAKEYYPNGTCVSTEYVTQWTVSTTYGQPELLPNQSEITELNLVAQTPSKGGCNSY